MTTAEFREKSIELNKTLSKDIRQEEGIYFTPKKVRERLFEVLDTYEIKPRVILEPSFGSGEFLYDSREKYPESKLIGIEKNETLYTSLKTEDLEKCEVECCDFLEWKGKADLIVGNPPYFILPSSAKLKKKYSSCMVGRPNIYILFLYKCLENHLEENGTLAFIIPTSLYNCSYYEPMREYIVENTTILHVETMNKPGFYETDQDVMLLVVKKTKCKKQNYCFRAKNGRLYISPDAEELYALTENTKTLEELGLGVKTGSVVWNQVKEKLSDDPTDTLLLYSSNLKKNKLVFEPLKGGKKQYVKGIDKQKLSGPVGLVERGYGNSYRFNSVYVEHLENFYAENHLNVIYAKDKESEKNIKEAMERMKSERTMRFIELCIGSGSVSATDLETLVPL